MSGYNLPDGVDEGDPRAPWNEEPERRCGTCAWWAPVKGRGSIGYCDRLTTAGGCETVGYWHTCDFWEEA